MANLMTLDDIFTLRERMAWREYAEDAPPWEKPIDFIRLSRLIREMAKLEALRAHRAGREFTPIYWYRQPGQQPIMTLWEMNDE